MGIAWLMFRFVFQIRLNQHLYVCEREFLLLNTIKNEVKSVSEVLAIGWFQQHRYVIKNRIAFQAVRGRISQRHGPKPSHET